MGKHKQKHKASPPKQGRNPQSDLKGSNPAAVVRNCHAHSLKHPIALLCSKCGLAFCEDALKEKYSDLYDPNTGSFGCPRCNFKCMCYMCLRRKIGVREYLSRVKELEEERDMLRGLLKTYAKESGDNIDELKGRCSLLKSMLAEVGEKSEVPEKASSVCKQCEVQRTQVDDLQERLNLAELKIAEGEKERTKLHNVIMNLKGRVRVFARIRPLISVAAAGAEATFTYSRSGEIVLNHEGAEHPFKFDRVFDGNSSQEEVFSELADLVQNAIDGSEVTIFNYGQTGSGKTHTLVGGPEEQKGLIPRSLEEVFKSVKALTAHGWEYKLKATVLEIYNETVCDLVTEQWEKRCSLKIKLAKDGRTYVPKAKVVDIKSVEEFYELLKKTSERRFVASTNMNASSSRSHFFVTLDIVGVNQNERVKGSLNFVDLAGCERLKTAGSERVQETQHINSSLGFLGKVISALARKAKHISYRDSKLTYLLMPYFQGDGKALMFVNLSPAVESRGESLAALQFAAKANRCEIGGC